MSKENKFRYTVIRPNGFTFTETFSLSEIENGDVKTWLKVNIVGLNSVIHRDQFIGLTDSEGVNIYEGDILIHDGGDLPREEWSRSEVRFAEGAFMSFSKPHSWWELHESGSEIIGTVHDKEQS